MLMQISSGKGPLECELAVGKFLQAIQAELADIEIVSQVQGGYVDCYKSVVIKTNKQVEGLIGTIKWIAQSPFRPKHKRKNWFIGVSLIAEAADRSNFLTQSLSVSKHSAAGVKVDKMSTKWKQPCGPHMPPPVLVLLPRRGVISIPIKSWR